MGTLGERWDVRPQRRALMELASFFYAFGNTKHTSLFQDNGAKAMKLLLLGFGDVRNVLATAAECAAQRSSQCRELAFDLCDNGLANVARGILLLHLAGTVDPASPNDLQFFWGVCYCLQLSAAHAQRLVASVRQLLDAPEGLQGWLGARDQAASVREVMEGWLQPPPPVEKVVAERKRLHLARWSIRAKSQLRTDADLADVYQNEARATLVALLPWPADWVGVAHPAIGNKALVAECIEYLNTGSIYPPSAGGCGDGGGWTANPTLLQPGSRAWRVHYGAIPFKGFLPLNQDRHRGLGQSARPRALTEACLAELRGLLQGWQACRAVHTVRVRFWCCDALTLCAGPLAAQVAGAGSAGGGGCYDVIDTSNLSDHLGLLNVLALTQPLLRPTPSSRLFTGHMVWPTGHTSLHKYPAIACGAPPSLFPTLLGLRLLNDPEQGRSLPGSPLASGGMTDNQERLEWMLQPLSPRAAPQLSAGDGISPALAAWADLAGLRRAVPPGDRSGLEFCSPLTLLHLVAGLSRRVRGLLPPGTSGWRGLADGLAAACRVPKECLLQLRALCCWALQGGEAGEQVLLASSGPLPLSELYREAAQIGATPVLGMLLIKMPGGGSPAALAAAMRQLATGRLPDMHAVDVLEFDSATEEVCFLLPPDHGLDPERTFALLADTVLGRGLTAHPMPLSQLCLAPFSKPPPPRLAAGLRWLLQEAAGTPPPPANGATLSTGLRLQKLAEHADRFELELAVERGQGGGLTAKAVKYEFVGAPPGGGACEQLKVTLKLQTPLTANLHLPWPVDSVAAAFRVQRSTGTLFATLPKDLLWPSDAAWEAKLDSEALPAWGNSQADTDRLGIYMSSMLSPTELLAKARGATLGKHSLGAMYDVRESLQTLFVRAHQGTLCFSLVPASHSSGGAPDAALYLFVHGGVRRLPDGRPLLHVSCVDQDKARRMYKSEAAIRRAVHRFSAVMQRFGDVGNPHCVVRCTEPELRILRFLLARNAGRMRLAVSLLGLPSEWHASFLVPLFHDCVDNGVDLAGQAEKLKNALSGAAGPHVAGMSAETGQGRGRGAGSSTAAGGAESPGQAAAREHRARGNALFKSGSYRAAAEQYRLGVEALAEGPGDPSQLIDLTNNLALAFIRLAEQQPSDATQCLVQAEIALKGVLTLDGANCKALYRRALALFRQGREAEAWADLECIQGSDDKAVQELRRKVAAALASS